MVAASDAAMADHCGLQKKEERAQQCVQSVCQQMPIAVINHRQSLSLHDLPRTCKHWLDVLGQAISFDYKRLVASILLRNLCCFSLHIVSLLASLLPFRCGPTVQAHALKWT